jgi:hypothetical protein
MRLEDFAVEVFIDAVEEVVEPVEEVDVGGGGMCAKLEGVGRG